MKSSQQLREEILGLTRQFHAAETPAPFIAGQSYIPCSGKVVDSADLSALVDASLDMWLTGGRYTKAFEEKLGAYTGLKHVSMTVSGSAANLLAFTALTSAKLRDKRIEAGSEVLTVAAGFPTTVAPIVQNGCVPVFVDVEADTGNVRVDRLAEAITPRTRAIMLAHTLGNPFDVGAVAALAKAHNLYLVEDCCDALGATFQGQKVGTFGDIATLSFYPAHHITTGEGGAVLTNNKFLSTMAESFRDWGRDCWCATGQSNTCKCRFDWKIGDLPEGYDHKYIYAHLGYNLKATDMQAALGYSQLDKIDGFIAKRRENFNALKASFESENLTEHFHLPQATAGSDPSWFGFLLTLREGSPLKRRDVTMYLEDHKIGTRLLFGGNLTKQPAFKDVNYRIVGDLDVTDKLMRDSFWIGVWPGIGAAHRSYMVDTFKQMIKDLVR